jgi:hypothetical protein
MNPDDNDNQFIAVLNRMCSYPSNTKQNQSHRQQQWNDNEKYLRKQQKYERQQRKLIEFNALPEFKPLKPYKIHFINRMTPLLIIFSLLEQVKRTVKYTIDSEGDWRPIKPAIIQVEFVNNHEKESTVLLFEMVHLPEASTRLFRFIKKLFVAILNPSHKILMWSDVKKELLDFLDYNLLSIDQINSINATDMQGAFKEWYNGTFPHHQDCNGFSVAFNDHQYCTCGEFLDKKFQRSRWSIGLDRRLAPFYKPGQQQRHFKQEYREKLVKYAVHDCLSVTKLAMVIENRWSQQQLNDYNHQH